MILIILLLIIFGFFIFVQMNKNTEQSLPNNDCNIIFRDEEYPFNYIYKLPKNRVCKMDNPIYEKPNALAYYKYLDYVHPL